MSAHPAVRDADQLDAALVVRQAVTLAREHVQHILDNHPSMGGDLGRLLLLGPLDHVARRKDAGVIDQLEGRFDLDEPRRRQRR